MGKSRQVSVLEETRAKLFLWCARHCCFCGKVCTTNIEIHHIDGNASNGEENNLIPVCFDCHGELNRYNPKHPKGSGYRHLEIKSRREQIYELHTLRYLRQVEIRISKHMHHAHDSRGQPAIRPWGDVSCTVRTLSEDIPVRLRLRIESYHDNPQLEAKLGDLYCGKALWNLNPCQTIFGHFQLPISPKAEPFHFRVEVFWSIVDVLDREHQMLPFSYVWDNRDGDWWFDPRTIGNSESSRTH